MVRNILRTLCVLLIFLVLGCATTYDLKPDREKYSSLSCQELKKEISIVVGYHNEAVGEQGLTTKSAITGFLFGGLGANLTNSSAKNAEKAAEEQITFLYRIYDEKNCAEELYQLGRSTQPPTSQVVRQSPTTIDPSQDNNQNLVNGTGFLFSSSNFIVTNFHVVKGSKSIEAKLLNGQTIMAEIVATDKNNDIAFLKLNSIPELNIGKITLGDSSKVRVGDKAFTVGFPLSNILGDRPRYSEGVINSISGAGNDPKLFQISIPIQPGNSGGPLFNESGKIIGMVTSSLDAETTSQVTGNIPQNVNFAIKAAFIKNLLPTIPETLISTTGVVVVPAYSKNKRSDFIDKIQNNIVLLSVHH